MRRALKCGFPAHASPAPAARIPPGSNCLAQLIIFAILYRRAAWRTQPAAWVPHSSGRAGRGQGLQLQLHANLPLRAFVKQQLLDLPRLDQVFTGLLQPLQQGPAGNDLHLRNDRFH